MTGCDTEAYPVLAARAGGCAVRAQPVPAACYARTMRLRLLPLLVSTCVLPAAAASEPPALALAVERVDGTDGGKVYQIVASGTVAATPGAVWRILTDYDHLADYVPNLQSAHVVSRDGDRVIVDQLGNTRFLFFSRAIHLVTQVHEQPPHAIDVTLVEGDMKVYRCRWTLSPTAAGGTRVAYDATIAPNFYVPGIVGVPLVRKDIAAMMTAVLARMERAP